MARGSKSKYTGKQKRQAEKIARGYKKRGTSAKTAKARAWATVNKQSGGGKKGGSAKKKSSGRKRKTTARRTGGRRKAA